MTISDLCLDGSPYSLPDGFDIAAELDKVREAEVRIRERINVAAQKLRDAGAFNEFYSGQRAVEIFESNRLEGLGPSISRTVEILDSPQGQRVRSAVSVLANDMFLHGLRSDHHLIEVLGLHGAKILAEQLRQDVQAGRPLTEASMREMHALIAADEPFKGTYKK